MPEISEAKAREIAQALEQLRTNPPAEVTQRIQRRLAERRRGMPRGASEAVLHTRMGY